MSAECSNIRFPMRGLERFLKSETRFLDKKRDQDWNPARRFNSIEMGKSLVHAFNGTISLCALLIASPALSEPRAMVEGVPKGELFDKIKKVVGDVESPASTNYEARRRGEIAEENIISLLRSEGYYQYNTEIDVNGTPPVAIVKVETGPVFTILNPKIEWVGNPPPAQLMESANNALELKPGDIARAQTILDAEGRALGTILTAGYADAINQKPQIIVNHENFSLNPTFYFQSGEVVRIGGFSLKGKTRSKEEWVKKISPIKIGTNYDPAAIKEFEKRILDTGTFEAVSLSLAKVKGTDGVRDLEINLTDRARYSVETALSYGTNEGFSFEGKLWRYNNLGRGDSWINRLVWGEIARRIESELRLPHFYSPNLTLSLALGAFEDDTDAYREKGLDLYTLFTKKYGLTSYWTIGAAANVANTREPSFLTPNNIIERDYTAISAISSFLYDRTDNSFNPKTGIKADAQIEATSLSGDASLSYFKLTTQGTKYFALNKDKSTILAGRFRIGSIIGATIPELPSGKRLYAGGGGSVRGFEFQGIGPRYDDIKKSPVGGLSLIETSLELRHDFKNKFGIVAFIDAGTLGINSTPEFSDFKMGAGLGLRYDLGFAPLRIDIGVPINRPQNSAGFQIYIGVGQSF